MILVKGDLTYLLSAALSRRPSGYGGRVRALVFDPDPTRLALAGAASRLRPEWALRGRAPLALRDVPDPRPPRPDWALLQTVATGICGSDVKEGLLQASLDNPLSGLVSFPHVPGHEVLARVVEPAAGGGVAAGELVAVDPWLGCVPRGLENPCPACAAGFPPHCRWVNSGGPWGPGWGMHIGNVRGLPGGFAPRLVAHGSQLHRLPAGLPPQLAVLADPLAVAMHAVEVVDGNPDRVLVLGAGTIGLGLALSARRRWPSAEVLVTCAWAHQHQLVERLGAVALPVAPAEVLAAVAQLSGAELAHPWRGGPWALDRGADVVLDSIGTPGTLELGLRSLRPRGRIVTVGVARPGRAETTLTYFKEAQIVGSNGYGATPAGHQLDLALERLAGEEEVVSAWLTHSFPLERWRDAFTTAARPGGGVVKVSITFPEGRPA